MADERAAVKIGIQLDETDLKKFNATIKTLSSTDKIKIEVDNNIKQTAEAINEANKSIENLKKTALGANIKVIGTQEQKFLDNYGNQLHALGRRLEALAVRADDASKKSFVDSNELKNIQAVKLGIESLYTECREFLNGTKEIDEFSFFNLKQGVGLLGTSLTTSISSSSKQLSTTGVEFQKLQTRIQTTELSLKKFLQNNPKARGMLDSGNLKQLNEEYKTLINAAKAIEASALKDKNGFINASEIAQANKLLSTASQKISQITSEIKLAGGAGDTFWSSMIKNATKYAQFTLVTKAIQTVGTVLTSVTNNVRELDTAMVELRKVTDETAETYERFLDNAAAKAGSLATTVTDLTNTTAEFAKLGYSIDDAFKLAQTATMYSNVGDLDVGEATQNLVSIMKSFNIEAKDSIQIVDMLNELGNNFAITSGDLGTAMEDSASALRASGNSLAESVAMVTAMNEIMQDTSKTSTALRTISSRLRNTAVELEAMGEDAEGAATTMSALRSEVKALSGVDIMADNNTYKNTYQILKELSVVWENLTDTQQAALTRLIAGNSFPRCTEMCTIIQS